MISFNCLLKSTQKADDVMLLYRGYLGKPYFVVDLRKPYSMWLKVLGKDAVAVKISNPSHSLAVSHS